MIDGTAIGVEALTLAYVGRRGRATTVVRDVSLQLGRGRITGLAGESGCGKSTLARALLGWTAPNCRRLGGRVVFGGRDLFELPRSTLRRYWGARLAYVPQEVSSALNPISIRYG